MFSEEEIQKWKIKDVQKWINVFKYKRGEMLLSYPHTKIPEIGNFTEGFSRYMGEGHFVYLFVKDYNEEKVLEIMNQKISPRLMAKQLKEVAKKSQVVMLDAEMGGMSVWGDEQ